MAKILVADDNSNIQKMVGLALKDQGIDVVAVGNGEAAVRKISDVRPDLVLADVFMPVRNGYEVCNYVKTDSALSHIPVILLVGAFDPLDEQEAQRVGADGVLKKPFVPPDPLISMVKAALSRAGVVPAGNGTPAAAPPPAPTTSHAKSEAPPLPRVAPPPPASPEPEIELGVPAIASRPAPVTIDKSDQPLAFSSLLDSPAEEEATFTTSSGASIAPDRDWGQHAAQEEEEVEEETSKTGSWRLNSMDEIPNEAPAGQTDWREAAFAGIGSEKSSKEWAPSVEKNSLSITEEEAAERAQKQEPLGVPATTAGADGGEDWSQALTAVFAEQTVAPQHEPAPAAAAQPPVAPVVEQAPAAKTPEPVLSMPAPVAAAPTEPPAPEATSELNSWMAGAVSPWEAELRRASELTSTWDSTQITPGTVEETSATEAFLDSGLMATAHEQVVEANEEVKAEEPVGTAPAGDTSAAGESSYSLDGHTLEEEISTFAAAQEPVPHETVQVIPPAAVAAHEPAPAPAADMDELVAKVLAKMNPEVLQAVTREILKPVVEALVKSELGKK